MDQFKVKDLMVPLSEYATVSIHATMFDAMMALEKAQTEFDHTKYRHRALLVLDGNQKVVGKLSQMDVLRALEPEDDAEVNGPVLGSYGFSSKFIQKIKIENRLMGTRLKDVLIKAGQYPVEAFMQRITEGEHVEETTSLETAIHQIVSGHHLSLLVTRQARIIGILRLTDVFAAVFHAMKESETPI